MALYSKRHKSLGEVKEGATVALPNDPTNQARALAILGRGAR
jgi:D-methionine transport system substrate-binding protein